jgi:hypothetical protein
MLNFSEGFPIVPETPTAGPLRLNAYAPGQVLAAYDGDNLEFLDPSNLTNPLAYTRGDIKKVETYNQYYALTQALGAMEGNLTGVSDGILGIANDPTKGATWRQFIGKAPLTPLRYGDSELTKEAIDADLKSLNMMLEAEEGVDVSTLSYDQLSDRQKQIRDLTAKIAYSEAQNKATEKLGFDWIDQMMAQDVFGLTGYFADQELAGDTKDIEKVLNREDPNFDSRSWYYGKFSDDIVSQYLLENGITQDFIADSPNADHAMMRIMAQLNSTDMQRRMATYTPTTADKFRLLRDTFVGGMINSPDTIPSATAELTLMGVSALAGTFIGGPPGTAAGAVAGGVAASAATTALGGTSLFLRLKKAYDAASFTGRALRATAYTTETLYKLPLGIMPSYVANFGLIRGAAASFTFGAVQGGLSEYARQKREIAFGAATLYANPNAMMDYNASMMATSALESGALFGGVFGLGGGLLRSGIGAVNNRLSGVLIDPKTGFRNIADKRFTFESTPLGNSIDNIRGVFNRRERALIDAPVVEKATMESVIENTEVTPEKLAADTEARVDRAETREAARSPDAARATPEDAGTRRYEGETVPEYVARVAPNRAVRNIFEVMTEFARRTTKQGSERFIEAGEQFDQMSIQDQMRVLFNGKKMLEDAKKAETEAVGLPKERERVYDELEKSRSAWFGRLKKKLTKEEFKAIKAEFEQGKKKSTRNLPELLKEARNTAKPAAERKADSDELSVRLLEAARSAATSQDREAAIKPEVPVEVLDTFDAAVIEHKLTGNISEETADTLRRSIAGEAPPKVSRVSRSFKEAQKALIAAKLDKDRVRKIKAIVQDPEKFVDLVEGNRDNALKFFNYVNELVDNDMISVSDRDLLLASVVHLNFNSRAFNVRFIVDSITGKDGNVDPSVIGQFSAKNNVIVMNRGFRGTAASVKTRKAKALLHELGHAYFEHETSGSNYLQALRLYNQSVLANTTELIQLRPETPDPLLNTEFLDGYHLQNVEEVFVETFSKILFTEAEAAMSILTPMQVSRLQSVLDKIATSVTLAAAMFDNSTHYKIAKEIIDSITDIESKTNTFVSMPKLAGAYAKLHKLLNTVENATEYNKALDDALEGSDATPFHLTQAEVNIFRNTKKDPGFIIALSIMKADKRTFVDANGNLTKGVVDLVNAYKDYKQAQFTSLQVKIANLIGTNAYSTLIGFDKFERLEIIKNELFSINSVEYRIPFIGKKGKPLVKAAPIIPALYQDRDLRSLDTMDYLDPTGSGIPYAVGFLGTNGNVLIEALASTRSSGKGLTPSSLSDIEADALIGVLRQDTALNTSLIDKLRIYLDNVGLPELSDMVVEAHHKSFIDNMKEEGVFSVSITDADKPAPQWPNKDVANTSLGLMLKEKLTLEQIQVLLKSNLSSSMYSYLVKSYKTPKKLVGAVSKLLEEDGLVLNEDTQTWGIKLTKSKKGAIAEAQKEAVTFETTVLTKDNLVDIVSQIIKKASRGETSDNFFVEAATSMIVPRPDKEEVGENAFAGNLELVLSKIEDGSLKTARNLIGYIHTTAANLKKPKKTGKRKTESLYTEQGTLKEGDKPPRITAADRITTTDKETRATIFSDIIEYNTATNGRILTEQEIKLIGTFMTSNSMEEAAAQLKVSTRTAGNYRTKLLAKITDIFEQTAVKMNSSKDEIITALNKHFDTVEAKVNKAKPSEPADVLKKVTKKKPKTEKSPVDAGALMAQTAAIAEKLKNKNPAPVPVPVPKDTEAVVYRVTDEVTGNAPDPVLRPAEQADAIIQGSSTASKEAVQFTPKRPLKMEVESSTELSKQPEKLAKIMKSADRLGMDALVFKDGSIIPVKIEDVKPIGETVIKKEPDAEPTVVITTDNKKPVLSVISKERKPQPKKQDFPVKVEKKKVPKKKPQPKAESKTMEPSTPRIPLPPKKEVPVEKTESEVVKTPEADRVERKVNEDPKLLRQSGMDVGFLKNFLKKYWESKIEADGGETMTPMFKKMWSHFVNVNQFIADANKRILGDDIMDKFWAAVDRIKADELRLKVTEGPGSAKKLKSYRQILEQAAKEVAVEGKPDFVIPMLPDEVKFIKTDEAGNYRMSARSKKTKVIIDTAGEDPVIAGPPKPDAVLRDVADAPAEDKPVVVEAEPPTPKEKVIGKAIDQTEAGASRLMRLNNLVGWVFGGNQRESRSWWENLMNKGVNASQSATGLGNTLRSTVDALAFVSRFFDDTKTQTGHLVGAGKTAFKTAMQLRAEEGRLMTRIFREYARMHNIVPRMTNATKAALDMYVYECLFMNRQPNKADLVALGIPAYKAEEVVKQASMVLKASRIANRNILDLESQTGRMSIVDENGNPVSSDTYAPVQLDHEGLSRLDQGARSKLLAAMVQARTNRKLKDPILDINTMIAMGWLDVAYNEDAKTLSIFTPDRVFKHAEMANMFSNETLQKLFVADMAKEGITGNKADIVRLLRKNQQEKFFVLETDTKYTVYRVPEKITDLAPADKAKYIEAVNGNTAMYIDRWRTKLNGKNLIEVEMKEMLKFKTKQYPYNNPDDFNSITKQPFFKIDPDGKTILPIKGLTPEEMLSSPETKAILRTNMAESYFYFLKGRYFELAFQKELDRMFGQTGITILDVFDYVEKTGYENFDTMAAAMNWTPQELSNAQKGLAEGLKRLREEYQFNADTLPYLNAETGHSARIGLAAIRFKFSAGYGISAMTETMAELAKQSPEFYMIPINIIKALRYVLADYRFSKRRLLESDIGDMSFVLENFRTDLANRFMGEIGYGAFKSDSRLDTKVASTISNIKDGQGGLEKATRTFEEAGKWMQSIGSLQAVTNGTRALAKQRIQRMIWKYVSKGKVEALFDALEETATATELAELKKAAATDSRAEAKLWKKFASVARHQAKFGDPNEAALFLKYGLTTKEQIRHLKWVMEKAGHKDGRTNILNLMDIHEDLRDNPVDGINPDILESAISAYAQMVEDLIIKTSTSELKGLNKLTALDARSPLGRMWYALTSWVRSYQDNVVLDYGSRSTIKYIASGIFLYAALDTMIGLFKEWLAGRETEDMLQELEDQPGQYVLRGVSRVPFLGIANGLIEAGVSTVAGMTGGTYKYYGVPLMPAGAGAGMGAIETDYRNIQKVIQDPISARSLKATSDLFGVTSLVNRSPVAIPVRMLEDMNTFKEMDAIQRYLDMVQRDPYPYSKRSQSQFKPIQLDYTTTPRNYALEQQQANEAMQREMSMRQTMPRPESNNTFPMVEDQKGVSERLGELLE